MAGVQTQEVQLGAEGKRLPVVRQQLELARQQLGSVRVLLLGLARQ